MKIYKTTENTNMLELSDDELDLIDWSLALLETHDDDLRTLRRNIKNYQLRGREIKE